MGKNGKKSAKGKKRAEAGSKVNTSVKGTTKAKLGCQAVFSISSDSSDTEDYQSYCHFLVHKRMCADLVSSTEFTFS